MEKKELDLFNPTKAELQTMATQYKDLTINGIDDKEGFKKVHEAEMILKKTRVTISKTRKAFTDPKNAEIKQAIELEKEMLGIISPIEDSLKEQKKAIEEEKQKIKEQEAEEKRIFLQKRVDELAKFDYVHHDLYELSQFSEEGFAGLLDSKKTEFEEKEAKRVEQEKKEELEKMKNDFKYKIMNSSNLEILDNVQTAILDNLGIEVYEAEFKNDVEKKKEMIEFDKKQAKLKADQDKLDQDKKDLEDKKQKEKDEKKRKEDLEKAKKEGEQKAKEEADKRKINTDSEIEMIGKMTVLREVIEKKMLHNSCSPIVYDKERLLEFILKRIRELEEVENQEKLEKEKKYKAFLKKNEGKYDIIKKDEENGKMILWKKVDEFIYKK